MFKFCKKCGQMRQFKDGVCTFCGKEESMSKARQLLSLISNKNEGQDAKELAKIASNLTAFENKLKDVKSEDQISDFITAYYKWEDSIGYIYAQDEKDKAKAQALQDRYNELDEKVRAMKKDLFNRINDDIKEYLKENGIKYTLYQDHYFTVPEKLKFSIDSKKTLSWYVWKKIGRKFKFGGISHQRFDKWGELEKFLFSLIKPTSSASKGSDKDDGKYKAPKGPNGKNLRGKDLLFYYFKNKADDVAKIMDDEISSSDAVEVRKDPKVSHTYLVLNSERMGIVLRTFEEPEAIDTFELEDGQETLWDIKVGNPKFF